MEVTLAEPGSHISHDQAKEICKLFEQKVEAAFKGEPMDEATYDSLVKSVGDDQAKKIRTLFKQKVEADFKGEPMDEATYDSLVKLVGDDQAKKTCDLLKQKIEEAINGKTMDKETYNSLANSVGNFRLPEYDRKHKEIDIRPGAPGGEFRIFAIHYVTTKGVREASAPAGGGKMEGWSAQGWELLEEAFTKVLGHPSAMGDVEVRTYRKVAGTNHEQELAELKADRVKWAEEDSKARPHKGFFGGNKHEEKHR